MSKIIALEFLNTIRLKAVNLRPNGRSVTLGGDNGAGKTSVLETIAMVLGGADATPLKPLHRGADKGHAIIKTDDGLTIRLPINSEGRGALTITTKDNAKYGSPQEVLKKLTGGGAFDPLEFSNMDAAKQRASLMKLLGLDFSALDAKRKAIYEERRLVNQNITRVEFAVEAMPHFPTAPEEPVNTADLLAELERANQHNRQADDLNDRSGAAFQQAEAAAHATANQRLKIADLEAQLAAARKTLEQCEAAEKVARAAYDQAQAATDRFELIDTAEITAKLSGATETNRQVQANVVRRDALNALATHRKHSEDLTAKLDEIDKQKAEKLASAPFPIAGLGFDDDGVTYNGNPLEQANFNERLRVSMAMTAALNPSLRVVIIRDASLLDDGNFEHLMKLLEEYDLQGFVERVSDGAECNVIIEDGTVAEVRDPAMQPEPTTPETPKNEFTLA